MSETTSSSGPATGPIESSRPSADTRTCVVREQSRLTQIAAWVGIVAGVVFIVAVIFFSGFVLGAHAGKGHGGHHRGGQGTSMHHEGPMMHQWPGFGSPGGPGGPGGPGMRGPQPSQSPTPSTSTAPTP